MASQKANDQFFDLVHSDIEHDDDEENVEMRGYGSHKDIFTKAVDGKKSKFKDKPRRPKSGYFFPATLAKADSNPAHQALFNMAYFEDANSSLNRSFIKSTTTTDEVGVSKFTIVFKML